MWGASESYTLEGPPERMTPFRSGIVLILDNGALKG